MTVGLGPLVVDAVDPAAVERFWATALGGPAQQALLSFRPQRRPKAVKNRAAGAIPSPDGVLVDPQGNEFSAERRTLPAG